MSDEIIKNTTRTGGKRTNITFESIPNFGGVMSKAEGDYIVYTMGMEDIIIRETPEGLYVQYFETVPAEFLIDSVKKFLTNRS